MLILKRRMNESICIDHDIKVIVLEIKKDVITFGIDAPQHVTIVRSELMKRRSSANRGTMNIKDEEIAQ